MVDVAGPGMAGPARRDAASRQAGSDAADRDPGWAEFLRSQAQGILALGFFTADLLNGTKAYFLAVIEHGSRRVRVLGATEHPVQSWVIQQARNLLMDLGDAGARAKFVLHDLDASFTQSSGAVFQAAGMRVIRSAVQAPRMNSIMERWIGSCRRELLDRTLIWNQRHLMTLLKEYENSCNSHRPHRTAGAVTTGRQNTASSPVDGRSSPAVTAPPRTRRPAARTTTVPAGVPATRDSAVRLATATSGR